MTKKITILATLMAIAGIIVSIAIIASTPLEELTNFEKNLTNITTGLQAPNSTASVISSDMPEILHSNWNKMLEKHATEKVTTQQGVVPAAQDETYIKTKQRVEQTLNTTIDEINKKLKK